MQVNSINYSNNNNSFKAKISPAFVNAMREFYNHGENRLKCHYKLNQKLEQVEKFGRNDYTIELIKNYVGYGTEFKLLAVKDGQQTKDGVVLAKRSCFRHIVNTFMKMNKKEFNSKFKK